MKNWTKEEDALLIVLIQQGLTTEEIAKKLGRSDKSVQHRRAKVGKGIAVNYIKDEEQKLSQKELMLELYNNLKAELSDTKPYEVVKNYKNKKEDTLIIHFTDWHVGRIVKNEFGDIVYDEKVFQKRIDILMEEMLTLLDDYIKKGTPIRDVVILSTGDILDGQGIFAIQDTLSEMSPPFQVMSAVKVIQRLILSLLKRKLTVHFYGVKGNHGEIRENGKNRDPNANWDLMLYLILDYWVRHALKTDRVVVQYSELDYLNFVVNGWKYHIRHIAPNQSETAAGKGKFLGWARKHGFDVLVYGHYHHWGIWDRSGITVFRGGSIPGADEFSESLAEESEPVQLIWGCNEKRPLTFSYVVDLGEKKRKH